MGFLKDQINYLLDPFNSPSPGSLSGLEVTRRHVFDNEGNVIRSVDLTPQAERAANWIMEVRGHTKLEESDIDWIRKNKDDFR